MLLFSTKIGNYRKNDIFRGGPKLTFFGDPENLKKSKKRKTSKSTFLENAKSPKSVNDRKIDIFTKMSKKSKKSEIIENRYLSKTQKVEKVEIIENRHFPKTQKVEKVEIVENQHLSKTQKVEKVKKS